VKVPEHGLPGRGAEETRGVPQHVVARVQAPGRGRGEEAIVGHAAGEGVGQTRGHLVVVERNLAAGDGRAELGAIEEVGRLQEIGDHQLGSVGEGVAAGDESRALVEQGQDAPDLHVGERPAIGAQAEGLDERPGAPGRIGRRRGRNQHGQPCGIAGDLGADGGGGLLVVPPELGRHVEDAAVVVEARAHRFGDEVPGRRRRRPEANQISDGAGPLLVIQPDQSARGAGRAGDRSGDGRARGDGHAAPAGRRSGIGVPAADHAGAGASQEQREQRHRHHPRS
jgi:hypothetical protein